MRSNKKTRPTVVRSGCWVRWPWVSGTYDIPVLWMERGHKSHLNFDVRCQGFDPLPGLSCDTLTNGVFWNITTTMTGELNLLYIYTYIYTYIYIYIYMYIYIYNIASLVHVDITNWKITIFTGETHYQWPVSIAMFVITREQTFRLGMKRFN